MHAVIKKNKARFFLLSGLYFLFLLYGINTSDKNVKSSSGIKSNDGTEIGFDPVVSSDSDIIKPDVQLVSIKTKETSDYPSMISKKSSKESDIHPIDDDVMESTHFSNLQTEYSKNKEIIPKPITNLDEITTLESDFTSKGILPVYSMKSGLRYSLSKRIEPIVYQSITPGVSILQKLNNQSFFKVLNPSFNKSNKRYHSLLALSGTTYVGGAIGLYKIWYSDYELKKFHFFDDSKEWLGMDKFGHCFSAYYETKFAFQSAKWTGLNSRKSLLVGTIASTLIQSTLEVLDGFSTGWGFSKSDFGMNVIGTALFGIQELIWHEQRISLKYSFSKPNYSTKEWIDGYPTSSVKHRATELYGTSFMESILKDYNGQTLWITINISSLLQNDSRFPKCLNFAVGYGAENLLGAFDNNWYYKEGIRLPGDKLIPRYRQFYLSLDLDLTKIKTKNPLLKTALFILNSIKIPAPTLEYSRGQFKFIPMHF